MRLKFPRKSRKKIFPEISSKKGQKASLRKEGKKHEKIQDPRFIFGENLNAEGTRKKSKEL